MQEETLSPSTQALLIAALLRRPWREQWHPADDAATLRYTAMTWSRAVRQIVALGVATVQVQGRVRGLRMNYSARETWQRVHSKFRSPIKRTTWAYLPQEKNFLSSARLSGLSALARHLMLVKPTTNTYALSLSDWDAVRTADWMQPPGWTQQRSAQGEASEIQIWTYSPAWVAGPEVDPLSLWLSLKGAQDEKLRAALNQLLEGVGW